MKDKLIYRIIFSIPIILIITYLVPILGIVLIIARQLLTNKKGVTTSIILLVISVIIFIFSFALIGIININQAELQNYAMTLLKIGIAYLIIYAIFKKIVDKIIDKIKRMFNNYQEKEYKMNKENNLKIKEKQMRSKTTNVMVCENCGASVIVTEKTAICPYCRSVIENEKCI